jgi:hypothetical protein
MSYTSQLSTPPAFFFTALTARGETGPTPQAGHHNTSVTAGFNKLLLAKRVNHRSADCRPPISVENREYLNFIGLEVNKSWLA